MQLIERIGQNPILTPQSFTADIEGMEITCLLNPGAFVFEGRTGLLLRVAVRPKQQPGLISFPVMKDSKIEIVEIGKDEAGLDLSDARVIHYKGQDYLTTLSYLCPVFSTDGIHFQKDERHPPLFGDSMYTAYGIEDCRVSRLEDTWYLTFTAVSSNGVAVGMKSTKDWITYADHGLIFPPHNKDCCLFEEKIGGKYYALHRPSSPEIGGNYIWIAESEDLEHWGNHRCIAQTRKGSWDSARVGAGASPIKTETGWLEIYHGANEEHQYCLGLLLLDLKDPSKVIARSGAPVMLPETDYEKWGFFGEVIFTNGHIVNGNDITIYYGAADEVICAATTTISALLKTLNC
ncbi:MAG: glycoside hydrolase family 130 protein [Niabella sp.]